MFEILDATIATAAMILGLSLIVQAIQQIIKQTLDLKSSYMRSELLAIFNDPPKWTVYVGNFLPINRLLGKGNDVGHKIVRELEERMRGFGFNDLHMLEDVDTVKLKKMIGNLPVAKDETLKDKFNEALQDVDKWFDLCKKAFQEHYERRMKYWAFGISLVVVMIMNANVIDIYKDFSTNKTKRDAVVAAAPKLLELAEKQNQSPLTDSAAKLNDHQKDSIITAQAHFIDSLASDQTLNLYRWNIKGGDALRCTNEMGCSFWIGVHDFFHALWKNALGWLAMALLVSLGSPFWYDFLKTVMGLKDRIKRK